MPHAVEVMVTPDPVADPATQVQQTTTTTPEPILGKFKTQDDLIAAYKSLEQKLGQQSQTKTETAPSTTIPATTQEVPANVSPTDLAKYEAEFATNGKLSDATYTELQTKNNLSKAQVDSIIEGRQAQATLRAQTIFNAVGGEENYRSMLTWAAANLSPAEQQAFNAAVQGGDQSAMQLAVDGLEARYQKNYGNSPNLVTGKGAQAVAGFKSEAEMMAAMNDPRYKSGPKQDPAYVASVEARIRAS